MDEELTLVVRRAASPDFAVLNNRIERLVVPAIFFGSWHNIIVAVNEDRWLARSRAGVFAEHSRMASSGHDLNIFGAESDQMGSKPICTGDDIVFVGRIT